MMRWLLFALTIYAGTTLAGDCVRNGSACVDATPCKTISGVSVCLQGQTPPQGGINVDIPCWEYEDTYTCIKPEAVNYCQPFVNAQPGCWQTNSYCSKNDDLFNTGCMQYTQTWRCGDSTMATPSSTIRLDDSFTLVSTAYDPEPCKSLATASNCSVAESVCTSTVPPVYPAGIDPAQVAPDGCYERKDTYACAAMETTSDCSVLADNPKCTLKSSECDSEAELGSTCTSVTKTYSCKETDDVVRTYEDCGGQTFCMDGSCFDAKSPMDTDIFNVVARMEAGREAGAYSDGFSIFTGVKEQCTKKLFKNCCKGSGGIQVKSNQSILSSAGMSVAQYLGGGAIDAASPYVYDFMFDNGIFADFAFDRLVDQATSNALASNFSTVGSFYGVTVWTGTASSIPALGGGTIDALFSTGGFNIGFDPYSMMVSLVLNYVISELMSCEQQDFLTNVHRDNGLCHYVGEYCSKKLPIVKICIERKRSYCCYNSKLARIINEQGRPQIGKSWGGAENPNCGGFTPEEFATLDFSRIDMTEFFNSITPRNLAVDSDLINNYMSSRAVEIAN